MIKRKELYNEIPELVVSTTVAVRFNEVDALGIVWHGHYISYFEDGREAFGLVHGIDYLTVQKHGFTTPIVKSTCAHKLPLRYSENFRIDTFFVNTAAAKLIFRYKLYNAADQLVCTGETVQVFLDQENTMVLSTPDFVLDWKRKVGIA